jgi:hypothetical protein
MRISRARPKFKISNFESLQASIGNGAPDSFVCGLMDILLFAFFRAEINGFSPAVHSHGKTRIHVHAAHRILHHLAWAIPGAGAGSGRFRGFFESGEKPSEQTHDAKKQQKLNKDRHRQNIFDLS